MEIFFVAIGGALGTLLRYEIGRYLNSKSKHKIPAGTFFVNMLGAFFLGFIFKHKPSENIYIFFADGFLGAFTTFSTFMFEGFKMFTNKSLNAFLYITITIVLGFFAFYLGFIFP